MMQRTKNGRESKPDRSVRFHFRCTQNEAELIRERMASLGVTSLGAYMRKVAVDGYIVKLDMSEIRALVTLLSRCSSNLNQYAKRDNETGSIYAADIDDLRVRLDEIWRETNGVLTALAGIK